MLTIRSTSLYVKKTTSFPKINKDMSTKYYINQVRNSIPRLDRDEFSSLKA
jgi:hypothetical protein